MPLEMKSVDSSFISEAGWNDETERLRVRFKSNRNVLEYACPRLEYDVMMADPRPGQYFRNNIYKHYGWEQV